MSNQSLTNAGRAFLATKQAAAQPAIFDRFMLANIDGLDYTQPVNQNEAVPVVADQIKTISVTKDGYVSPDEVVYSLYLGTDEGDYTYNWLGLLADDDTLVAVAYLAPIEKYKSAGGAIGNAINENIMVAYSDAQAITNITVDANTWQWQFEQASTTEKGLVELATQTEMNGESDTQRPPPVSVIATYVANKISALKGGYVGTLADLSTAISQRVLTSSIVNNLTSTASNVPLAAGQGKALNDLITAANNAINLRVTISSIVNNLTSTATNVPLSANQGRVLNNAVGLRVLISSIVNNLTSTATNVPLSAAQGKVLKDLIDNLTYSTVGAAAESHNHSAGNITSGTLPVARGGTGTTSSTGSGATVRNNAPSLTNPTVTTQANSDISAKAANTQFVKNVSLGFGQTWQDLSGSRSAGVTYTNTTGKPIVVMLVGSSNTGNPKFFIDGLYAARLSNDYDEQCVTAIIPAGSTYLLEAGFLSAASLWLELR